MAKCYKYFYHYNKPASLKAGKPQLSVHFKKTCHIVDAVICAAVFHTKNNKKQPHCVITGECSTVVISNNTAIIWDFELVDAINEMKNQHKHE